MYFNIFQIIANPVLHIAIILFKGNKEDKFELEIQIQLVVEAGLELTDLTCDGSKFFVKGNSTEI